MSSYYSTTGRMKNVSIPDHVPVGAVIGRGGSYCKALRENHGVRCTVDGNDRKVTLKGSRHCIESAEDELVKLFTSFATTKSGERRVFDIVARDGPSRCWAFRKDEETSSNVEIQDYSYRLRQFGEVVETTSQKEAWIKEFREDDIANVMAYLLETPSKVPIKISAAFGKLCFQLKSIRCEKSTITWPELQQFSNFRDFLTRWSNYCKRTLPSIVALMDSLEEWMEKGVEPKTILSVHVIDSENSKFHLRYHLVEGQWELHKVYNNRHVRGSYDVILDNDISIRLRAVTREKISKEAVADIQGHLDISIPDNGDIFSTKVSLGENAPIRIDRNSVDVKSTVHVEANGLRFGICYLDQTQEEFRLECRLSDTEKQKLDVKDNQAPILLAKVLQTLS